MPDNPNPHQQEDAPLKLRLCDICCKYVHIPCINEFAAELCPNAQEFMTNMLEISKEDLTTDNDAS
jgi:hypothetical protein